MVSLFYEEHIPLFFLSFFALFLAFIFFGASFFISLQHPEAEKLSSYECGFDPYEDARNCFDIRFFIVAILFLIFDLEAMFLFPWILALKIVNNVGFFLMLDFLIELIIGFVYIWKTGIFEWK